MVVIFHTKNLNQRTYRRVIRNIVLHLSPIRHRAKVFLKIWDIYIIDLKDTNSSFFNHVTTTSGQRINPKMPSGVTGKYEIKLFLHDSSNVFKMRENFNRIQHEICHALLYEEYGTKDKKWVDLVHQNRFAFKEWFWYSKYLIFWKRIPLYLIDIRKYLL